MNQQDNLNGLKYDWSKILDLVEYFRSEEKTNLLSSKLPTHKKQRLLERLRECRLIEENVRIPLRLLEQFERYLQKQSLFKIAEIETICDIFTTGLHLDTLNLSGFDIMRERGVLNPIFERLERLAFNDRFMKCLGKLACAVCGCEVRNADVDPETQRYLCRNCMMVGSVDTARETAESGLKGSDNLYHSYSALFHPRRSLSYQYDVFVSYRHIPSNEAYAQQLASSLVARNFRVFYAPQTLSLDNQFDHNQPTKWAWKITQGLVTSVQCVVVLSPAFLASTYCELELRTFYEISRKNPDRRLWLALHELQLSDLPEELRPLAITLPVEELASKVTAEAKQTRFELASETVSPLNVFEPLPLETSAWSETGGTPSDPDPSYAEFQWTVRELMILQLRGANLDQIDFHYPECWQTHHFADARAEVQKLLDRGISPYPKMTHENVSGGIKLIGLAKESSEQGSDRKRTVKRGPRSHFESWYERVDYGGQHYPQDMAYVCQNCKHEESVGDPRNPPESCPKCGWAGEISETLEGESP